MYTLTLEITKRCNLKCRYCYVQKNEDMMQLDVGYKSIDISLRQAKKTNDKTLLIYFIGGEPLLKYDSIKKYCEYAKEKAEKCGVKVKFSITSNGILFNEDILDYFIANKFALKISLDGMEEVHNRNRCYENGTGSYEAVYKNINKLKKYEYETGVSVSIAQVVCPNTCNQLFDSVRFIKNMGFSVLETSINVYEDWSEKSIEQLKNQIKEAFYWYKDIKGSGSKFYWNFIEARIRAYANSSCFYRCRAGINSLFVNEYGEFFPCTEVDENVKIGDFQQGIDIKKARKLLEIKDSENQDCLECREYKQCTACKCIMVNYDLHRDFYKVPLIECEITKMLYEILRKNFSEKQFDILRISS